ncbi:MAG: hypothetical protein ACXWP5_07090 [Bdellovibrionota bacterium]
MKGTFFQKPLEYRLEVEGESWNQGDPVRGALIVKNHGADAAALDEVGVHLADGMLRKVRAKSPEAFDLLASASFEAGANVAPQNEARLSWEFTTDRNCQITDSFGSLFLVYGRGKATEAMGQLQMAVRPEVVIQEFLKALTITFRFVQKGQKSSKNRVEVKLAPPDGNKGFVMVESLTVFFKYEDAGVLAVDYVFLHVKKSKKEVEQTFRPDEYRVPSGRFNHDHIEASIRETLSAVESKVTF